MTRYATMSMKKFTDMVMDHDRRLSDATMPLNSIDYRRGGLIQAVDQDSMVPTLYNGVLNDNATAQLCKRLHVPQSWVKGEHCPGDLEETVMNRLINDHDEPALLRFREEPGIEELVCRAVLTDRYAVYNHARFWKDIQRVVENTKLSQLKPEIWKPTVGDRMSAWLIALDVEADLPDLKISDGGGHGSIKPAIHFGNSEDGTGTVKIRGGLYRSFCANGVIMGFNEKSDFRAVHLGRSNLLSQKTAIAVAGALDAAGVAIQQFAEACKVEIDQEVNQIIDGWSKRFKVKDDQALNWEAMVVSYAPKSWGDVIMATSDYAGTLIDPDDAIQFESIAGQMLVSVR